jgi:hypothetical protein
MLYRRRSLMLAEIVRQCRFAMRAYAAATAAIDCGDEEALWSSMEALLGAAAHIHQLLWPHSEGDTRHADEFRLALAIAPDSPLAWTQLRAIWDLAALVDQWTARPGGAVRGFDREASQLRYYGLTFDLPPLLGAIAELEERAIGEVWQMRQVV